MILLPRPAPHLPRTLAALHGAGLGPLLALPLSQPQHMAITLPADVTGIIFTSPFGVHPALPRLPACCVGEHTAQVAQSMGFPVILIGTSNAHSMVASIVSKNLPPQNFLHPHGDHAGTGWYAALTHAGHRVTPVPAYRTHLTPALTPAQTEALRAAPPTHTLLFSAGSAKHLAKLLKHANIPPTGTALALSAQVARVARAHWPRVITAPTPTLAAMVKNLTKDLAP